MKFSIYKVQNGYLLNITYSRTKIESWIFNEKERMTMLAKIDQALGDEPKGSVGMEEEDDEGPDDPETDR
jgi:hypothetical protein